MVSLETAAELMDVSVKTLRRMIARGELRAVRFGSRLIRVRVADLEAATTPMGAR